MYKEVDGVSRTDDEMLRDFDDRAGGEVVDLDRLSWGCFGEGVSGMVEREDSEWQAELEWQVKEDWLGRCRFTRIVGCSCN